MKKKNITIDIESAEALMQEIYNDVVEQKNTANIIMKKMLNFMKNSEDMSVIGPVIKEQQKIMNDCTEKKLSLVKLQSVLLKQTSNGGKASSGQFNLNDDEKLLLEKLINSNDTNDDNIKYTEK
jgi:hypothetical protein